MKKIYKIYIAILTLILLTPLGLITNNSAWGEWGSDYYKKALGYIPKGILKHLNYNAPMSDYSMHGLTDVEGYYLSAVVGVIAIFAIFFIIKSIVGKRKHFER